VVYARAPPAGSGVGDQNVLDQYTTFPWATLCREVAKLRIELREGKVIALPFARAAGAEGCDSTCDRAPNRTRSQAENGRRW
jgi:hypothetical protein